MTVFGGLLRIEIDLVSSSISKVFAQQGVQWPESLRLVLKILSYLALIISLIYCFLGFKPQIAGKIILPEELIEKCLDITEEEYRLSILENWNQSIKELAKNRDKISDLFKGAIWALICAAILSAIDVILSSFLVK